MKKTITVIVLSIVLLPVFSQNATYERQKFCNALSKIFESGRVENFESLAGMNSKQSPFLQVPGPNIKLEGFPVLYVDKDSRFVGKTNLNMDSVSALKKVDELKAYISSCLDSSQWFWLDFQGDDSSTVFFKEVFYWQSVSKDLTLTLSAVNASGNSYSANLYIRRNKR